MNKEKIEINGIKYVRESSIKAMRPKSLDGHEWCMIRTYSAGVFYGQYDTKTKGKEGMVYQARRVFYWDGAASLSQLATDGTSKPENCKFPLAVDKVILKEIIEVIPMTKKAKDSLDSVKIWSK